MSTKTLHQTRQEGLNILVRETRPDDAIRFLNIYEPGSGDWTKDRKNLLEKDPDKIVKSIMARRKKSRLREQSAFFLRSVTLHSFCTHSYLPAPSGQHLKILGKPDPNPIEFDGFNRVSS